VIPAVTFARHGKRWFVTTVDDADPCRFAHPAGSASATADRPRYAGASIPDVLWLEAVAEATRAIADGPLEKVVLARDFAVWSKSPFDPRRILHRLHERFPDCYTFLVDGLVGASPELLVRRTGRRLDSVALAGSARRSDDPEEDERIGRRLLESDKDRREHEMAAWSVAEALGEMCDRVVADAEPSLLRLANVQHLATQFRATLSTQTSVIDVVRRLHPTAAVGGWPTAEAVDTIRRLEGMNRGRYAGPVGWFDARGDGEFAIALRCAELSGARARLFAGAGIVRGSLPESELEETRLKLQAMLAALEV
jgi:menaquinone-specific isochorismate synthase